MLSVLAIVVSLLLLMFFAYRGYSVLLLAPLMAAVAVVLSGEGGWMLPIYTETFMSALGNYLLKFFPVFLLGALFGRLIRTLQVHRLRLTNGVGKHLMHTWPSTY